jgi:hypothetical protein
MAEDKTAEDAKLKKGAKILNIPAPSSPVHNFFYSLAFSMKTTPHSGDGATE